jgi:hypothetical protein
MTSRRWRWWRWTIRALRSTLGLTRLLTVGLAVLLLLAMALTLALELTLLLGSILLLLLHVAVLALSTTWTLRIVALLVRGATRASCTVGVLSHLVGLRVEIGFGNFSRWSPLRLQYDINASKSLLSLVWPVLHNVFFNFDASNCILDRRVVLPKTIILDFDELIHSPTSTLGFELQKDTGNVFALPPKSNQAVLDIFCGYILLLRVCNIPGLCIERFFDGPQGVLRIRKGLAGGMLPWKALWARLLRSILSRILSTWLAGILLLIRH